MSRVFSPFASCSPSAESGSYIYSIVPCSNGTVAGITSANELFLVDGNTLRESSIGRFPNPPTQLSSLVFTADGHAIICAGASGEVRVYDVRTQKQSASFRVGKAVTALTVQGQQLAVGTEYVQHQAIVGVWDLRSTATARWQNAENHDDITALDFHPSQTNIVLAGGDDGSVSLFDSNIVEEDDSLLQGLNQGPVHKAGFLNENSFYALSCDQHLALHPVFDDARAEEPEPVFLGDVRPLIPCEYVIDIVRTGGNSTIAAGSHSKSQVDIVPINGDGTLDGTSRIVLRNAHGEEIVRSIFVADSNNIIFTAGEDGQIQAYREVSSQVPPSKPSKSKKSSGRYEPY